MLETYTTPHTRVCKLLFSISNSLEADNGLLAADVVNGCTMTSHLFFIINLLFYNGSVTKNPQFEICQRDRGLHKV